MIKKYMLTLDEAIYPQYRVLELLGTIKKMYVLMLFIITMIPLVLYFVEDTHWSVCTITFLILFISFQLTYKRSIRKSIQKQTTKAFGSLGPYESELEFDEDSISFKRGSQKISFQWNCCVEVIETSDNFEFIFAPIGIAVLLKRIFDDNEIEDIRSFLARKFPELYHPNEK